MDHSKRILAECLQVRICLGLTRRDSAVSSQYSLMAPQIKNSLVRQEVSYIRMFNLQVCSSSLHLQIKHLNVGTPRPVQIKKKWRLATKCVDNNMFPSFFWFRSFQMAYMWIYTFTVKRKRWRSAFCVLNYNNSDTQYAAISKIANSLLI